MLEKLNYKVIKATSEEPGYHGSELEKQGPTVVGWKSAKLSSTTFPQEIIFQLESRSKLGHLQLLLHQYLIPERIELFVGESLEDVTTNDGHQNQHEKIDVEKIQFILLGKVTPSSNQGMGYKARELKSISLEAFGSFCKLVIGSNYRNKYNPHNQVALVAVSFFGEKVEEGGGEDNMTKSTITFEEITGRDRNLISPWDDISFTMYIDCEVQELIKKMDLKKQEAVLDERFDYASKLKTAIEQLRKNGETLAKFQLEKQIAANREDFGRAKDKKTQMESLRSSSYKSLRVKQLLEPNGRIPENDEPGKFLGGTLSRSTNDFPLNPPTIISAASTPESTTSERFSRLTTPDNEKRESGYLSSSEEPKLPQLFIRKRRPLTASHNTSGHSNDKNQESHHQRPPTAVVINRPSNLSDRARRYAALPISVFGEHLVEKLFSKNFAVKEDGIRSLQRALSDYKRDKTHPPSKIFRAATLLLQRTIKDIIFGVFNLTITALMYLMDEFSRKHRLPHSELASGLERIFPELLSKSGDTALGKNRVATECILKLQSCQHIRVLNVISVHLTKAFDIPVLPRLAQSKTEMVEELLKTYGINSEKNCGMAPRDYVEFAVSALNLPTESVRRVAERIIISLYHNYPKLIRSQLPLEEQISQKNIQFRHLFQQFDKIDRERKDGSLLSSVILKDTIGKESQNQAMTSSVYIPKI